MQSLRIALALFGLVLIWFLVLPAEPTLLSPSRAPVVAATETVDDTLVPEAGREIDRSAEPADNRTAIRSIVPSPLTQSGGLKRLPPVSSGAAAPISATPPSASAAGASDEAAPAASLEVASANPVGESAPAPIDPAKPDLRLFPRPIAVDTQTLKVGDTTLRLAGVEPIAPEARCVQGVQAWPCGARARTAFRAWLRGRSLLCNVPTDAADSRDLTVPCLMGEEDVGAWLVSNGWAAATPGGRYEADEQKAREARKGIWAFDVQG